MALAHTLDDQDETLRMRAARGASSLSARAGMAEATLCDGFLWLCRPFLAVSRADIRQVLVRDGITWIDDPSNEDRRFERVRLRQRPDLEGRPQRLAAAREARQALIALHAEAAKSLALAAGSPLSGFEMPLSGGAADATAVAVQALIDLAGGAGRAPDTMTSRRISAFLEDGRVRRLTAGRALLSRQSGLLRVERERRGLPEPIELAPGSWTLWDGRFHIRNLSQESVLRIETDIGRGAVPIAIRDGRSFRFDEGVRAGFAMEPAAGRAGRLVPDYALPVAREIFRLAGPNRRHFSRE